MWALRRLELLWRGSDIPMNESANSLGTSGTEMGTGTSIVGEERVLKRSYNSAAMTGLRLTSVSCIALVIV